jgi:DNA-binding NarL/FixJ family response regulator
MGGESSLAGRRVTITVLLVDDQALLRKGFRMILEEEPGISVVGEASNADEAVALASRLNPDVVLMDVRMPGTDGIEATDQIVRSGSSSRILILTTFDLDEYAFAGLRAGASGFILKDVPPQELVGAIRAVASGDAVISPRVTRRLLDTVAHQLPGGAPDQAHGSGRLDELTERELEVLAAVAEGLSNAEIADQLFISDATVKTHVRRILSKLDLRDRVQATVFAFQVGLVKPSSDRL